MKLGFIGTGNLASAILRGVVAAGKIKPEGILIYDIFTEKVTQLASELGVNAAESAVQIASECENVVIAVKPKDFASLADGIKNEIKSKNSLVISTAAGTEISKITSYFGFNAKIVRIMPNLNAAAGESMTAFCVSSLVSDEERSFANEFCSCFGKCVELEEKYFSAFTALAGSAPAFAFMFADALANAGVKYGIPAKISREIAAQMLFGSAKLMLESPLALGQLIANVCSPGGTTIEGVCSLKETGFESSVITAVDKTVEKDKMMNASK